MNFPSIKTCRRILQITVALAFVVIPYVNRKHINIFYGNFLSFNAAGVPLADPLAALQVLITSGHLSSHLLIGSAIALVTAAFLGTVFCSWVCPFGLISELARSASKRFLPDKAGTVLPSSRGFAVKSFFSSAGLLVLVFLSNTPVLNQVSMPGWYSRIFQLLASQSYLSYAAMGLLLVISAEFLARDRLWCRYVCPQAWLLVLAKLSNVFRMKVRYRPQQCLCAGNEVPCRRSCSLSLDPRILGRFPETECTNCGDCIVECKTKGRALGFTFRR